MYCYSCGKENPDAASFCHACGKGLASSDRPEERMGKRINPNWFTFSLWAGILFLVVGTLSITVLGTIPAMVILGVGTAFILFSVIYLLISLYRCWGVLHGFSPRTTPSKAVGFSLIPFFNTYWVFVAIYGLAVDANAFTEQGGSKKKINETLSMATCFILILPFVNLIVLILMTFLIYQWANFCNTATSPVDPSFVYPVPSKGRYLQGKFNINKVFACGLAGILLIIIGTEMIKAKRHENASAEAIEWFNKGFNYSKNKEYDKAIAAFTSAINLNQNYAQAYCNRGNAHFDKDQYALAIQDYGKAIAIKPNYAEAYYYRALVNYNISQYDKAIEDCNKLIEDYSNEYNKINDNPGADYKKAIIDNEALTNDFAYNVSAIYYRGLAYDKKGQYDRAIINYNSYIEIMTLATPIAPDSDVAKAYHSRGFAYSKKGQYSRAIEDYNKAIAINTGDADVFINRGVAYMGKGQHDLAIEDYSKAIIINPNIDKAYVGRGFAHAMKGNSGRATSDFQKACNMGNEQACETLAKLQNKK